MPQKSDQTRALNPNLSEPMPDRESTPTGNQPPIPVRLVLHFENGKVTVPDSFHKAWKALCAGEWLAMTEDPDWGGQGMPRSVAATAADFLMSASFAFIMYAGLTHGAGKLVETFGTEKQKKLFLKKLFAGEWTGTMLLTEPSAGSDVGALTTTATPNGDGTYSIVGNKIFYQGSGNIGAWRPSM